MQNLEVVAHRGLRQAKRAGQMADTRFLVLARRDEAQQLKPGGVREDFHGLGQLLGSGPAEGGPDQPGPTALRKDFHCVHQHSY